MINEPSSSVETEKHQSILDCLTGYSEECTQKAIVLRKELAIAEQQRETAATIRGMITQNNALRESDVNSRRNDIIQLERKSLFAKRLLELMPPNWEKSKVQDKTKFVMFDFLEAIERESGSSILTQEQALYALIGYLDVLQRNS